VIGGTLAARYPALPRLGVYLRETYPVPQRAAGSLLIYAGLATLLARLHDRDPGPGWSELLLGGWAVFAFTLVLRLMDELKDVEIDRALFPARPLPSGRVRESDIAWLLRVVAAVFVLAHVGAGWALLTAAVALAWAELMRRWFFVPDRMRHDLPLTLATHNPVVPLLLLHLVALHFGASALPPGAIRWGSVLLLVGAGWAAFFAWEVARKVRAPGQEDAYVTYSRLLGHRVAVGVVVGAQSSALLAGLLLHAWHGLSAAFVACLVAGYAVALAGAVRFLVAPAPETARLRPLAEAQIFSLFLAGVLA